MRRDDARARARWRGAFTLIELLVVIAVAGIVAALAIPAIKEFGRSNKQVAATRQMLNDVGRARQLAIANRTTVYMVFLPNGFSLPGEDESLARRLAPGQGRSYALLSLRSIGDQPGQPRAQYLSDWTTLPQGWIIAPTKFAVSNWYANLNTDGPEGWGVSPFALTNNLPFPSIERPVRRIWLPYIAFDHTGSLTSMKDEFIPLARGVVDEVIGERRGGRGVIASATIAEDPPFNSQSNYNLIHIDWLTGRARLEERRIE